VPETEGITRADLIFYGVDHSGPSYEARVFLDNPKADHRTPTEPDQGYAGSFTVFGNAGCFGDEGHCHPNLRYSDEFDYRGPHPLEPFTRHIEVTEALLQKKRRRVVVSVVPVVHEDPGVKPPAVAPAERVRLVAYQG
jgi:hypothetical protein